MKRFLTLSTSDYKGRGIWGFALYGLVLSPAVAFAQRPPEFVPTFAQDSARVYPRLQRRLVEVMRLTRPEVVLTFVPAARPEQTVLIDGSRIGAVGEATEVDRNGSLKEVL